MFIKTIRLTNFICVEKIDGGMKQEIDLLSRRKPDTVMYCNRPTEMLWHQSSLWLRNAETVSRSTSHVVMCIEECSNFYHFLNLFTSITSLNTANESSMLNFSSYRRRTLQFCGRSRSQTSSLLGNLAIESLFRNATASQP